MSRDCPNGKGKGKGAYECAKSNYDGNKGSNYGMYKGGGKGNTELSCPVKGYQKGDGKSGGGRTPSWQVLHLRWRSCRTRLPQRWRKRRIQGIGSPGRLGKSRHLWNTHVFCHRYEEAPPKHAGPQRVPGEVRKKFTTCADMNCNCKGGPQQIEGEVPRWQDYKQKVRMENGR